MTGRAEGNPLFVEELTATLVEAGLIERDEDGCRLTRAADDIDVPGTVQEVILARIDRLERERATRSSSPRSSGGSSRFDCSTASPGCPTGSTRPWRS